LKMRGRVKRRGSA
jgi:hypothetical protein